MLQEAKTLIEKAWRDRRLLKNDDTVEAVKKIIELLDKGSVRVAEPTCAGEWLVNEWIKKAVILYFPIQECELIELGPYQYFDKIPLKTGYPQIGARFVPGSIVRYGSFIEKDVILMPSFVNIGSHVQSGSLIDTFATIGSCAQIGKNVHIGGGTVIGGVLEPPQATPVIVEDGCFVGAQCNLAGGVYIQKGSIIASHCTISQATKIFDVSWKNPVEYEGEIPPRSIVMPGAYNKKFKSGNFPVNCVFIVGQRKESDDLKNSLNSAIKEFGFSV